MSSPVSSLLVGDRLVSRCDDGLLEAEYALFDRSETLVSPGAREEGYMTQAGFARARLYAAGVTADLAHDAFAAMRGRLMRPLARSTAVREVIDQLGPYETFQGGRFMAGRGRFTGVWLDLDALAAACPLRDASILLQAVHLLLALEEAGEDAPVRLLTTQTGNDAAAGGRTWRRVDLEAAQRLPWVLREMQAPNRTHGAAFDEAEVREEILRDLHTRASTALVPQPRLGALAAAIARTGLSSAPPPPPRTSSSPQRSARPSPPPPYSPSSAPIPKAPPVPQTPLVERSADAIDFSTALQQHRMRTGTEVPSDVPPPPMPAVLVSHAPPQMALAVRPAPSSPPAPQEEQRALDPRLILLSEPDSPRSASFRLLRDNLIARRAPSIVAVSSGAANEGKTTCAINLALALSERPLARVLLVEGNFSAPSLADVFHVDATTPQVPAASDPSLAPYRVVQVLRAFHVAVLVRERGAPAPTFNGRWFENAIHQLAAAGYDHVIIDAAALDGSAAVRQLIGVAEGVLLTARSHTTTARILQRAAAQIPEGRALGVTLMDADS